MTHMMLVSFYRNGNIGTALVNTVKEAEQHSFTELARGAIEVDTLTVSREAAAGMAFSGRSRAMARGWVGTRCVLILALYAAILLLLSGCCAVQTPVLDLDNDPCPYERVEDVPSDRFEECGLHPESGEVY